MSDPNPLATARRLVDELHDLTRRIRATREPWIAGIEPFDPQLQRVELANLVFRHRAMRGQMMPPFATYEPNWRIALALFIATPPRTPVPVATLREAAGLSDGATRRRVALLERHGLIERAATRPCAYRLSEAGEQGVGEYLDSIIALLV